MQNEKYYIYDYESGWPIEVTKEQWERHEAIRAHFAEKMQIMARDMKIGNTIIFGTAGEFDNSSAQQLFYNPKNFDYATYRDQWEETTRQGYFIPAYQKPDIQQS